MLRVRKKVREAASIVAPGALLQPERYLIASGWKSTCAPPYQGWVKGDRSDDRSTEAAFEVQILNEAVTRLEGAGWVVTGGVGTEGWWLWITEMRDPIARQYVRGWTAPLLRQMRRQNPATSTPQRT